MLTHVAPLPLQVLAYSRTIYGVVAEHRQLRQPGHVQVGAGAAAG